MNESFINEGNELINGRSFIYELYNNTIIIFETLIFIF
jgi:hypothetical protein